MVILEAMEYKLPVISTNEGGIPDMVKDGENGLICEKQNPVSLADCIAKLLDDEELRVKMGSAGHEKFSTMYLRNNAIYSEVVFISIHHSSIANIRILILSNKKVI